MAGILGLRGTGDWGTDERPKNFRETILWNMPEGDTPLLGLMGKMGDESVNDPEFSWWEEQLTLTYVQINKSGDYTSADVTLVVDSGAKNLVVNDMLEVAVDHAAGSAAFTAEIVRVAAMPTSDTAIVVERGFAGTTAAAILDNAVLVKIGSAFEEGSGPPRGSTRNPTKLSNYTQIFKTVYEMTGTAAETNFRTGDPVKNDKKRKMHDHSVAMEMAMLFGRASETTGPDGKPLRTMGGLLRFLTTNNYVFSGTSTGIAGTDWNEDNFLDKVSPIFNWQSPSGNQRLCLCGNGALNKLNILARNSNSTRINFDGVIRVFGMSLNRWILPQGELLIKTHPLYSQHPKLNNAMTIIAPASLKYRYLRNRDTKFEDNIQLPGYDSLMGQWMSECSLEVHHEYTMGHFAGFGG